MNFIELIKKNRIDYSKVAIESVKIQPRTNYDLLVIIGVRDRDIAPVLDSFMANRSFLKVGYVVVEHNYQRTFDKICKKYKIDYVWLKCEEGEPYNRSLAFNVGYLCGVKAQYVMTHDADCLVQWTFFDDVFKNLRRTDSQAIQPYSNHRVIYCNEALTNLIKEMQKKGAIYVNSITEHHPGTFTVPGMAMGGSIMVKSSLFERVGMYDPELFTGYAPEDQFFWNKLAVFTEVATCDDPVVNIFHLHHEFMGSTNPRLKEMNAISQQFAYASKTTKLQIINSKIEQKILWL